MASSSNAVASLGNGNFVDLAAFANFPAAFPPPGVKANFIDPPRYSLQLFISTSVFVALMLFCLFLRALFKIRFERRATWDDASLAIGALGALTAFVGAIIANTIGWFGYDQWNLKVGQIASEDTMKGLYIFAWGGSMAPLFIKLAFFILFWRLFGILKWVRWALIIGGTLITLFNLVSAVVFIWAETPDPGESFMHHTGLGRTSVIGTAIAVPVAAVSLAADLFILIVPLIALSNLQMQRNRKFSIALVFLAGILACVASAINIVYRMQITNANNISVATVHVQIFSIIEYCVGASCCCAPSISHLLHTSTAVKRSRRFFCWGQRRKPSTATGASGMPGTGGQYHTQNRQKPPTTRFRGLGTFFSRSFGGPLTLGSVTDETQPTIRGRFWDSKSTGLTWSNATGTTTTNVDARDSGAWLQSSRLETGWGPKVIEEEVSPAMATREQAPNLVSHMSPRLAPSQPLDNSTPRASRPSSPPPMQFSRPPSPPPPPPTSIPASPALSSRIPRPSAGPVPGSPMAERSAPGSPVADRLGSASSMTERPPTIASGGREPRYGEGPTSPHLPPIRIPSRAPSEHSLTRSPTLALRNQPSHLRFALARSGHGS